MSASRERLSTPGEILRAALRKEQAAHRFYDELLKRSKIGISRELLERLREEEGRHVRIIEKELAALRRG